MRKGRERKREKSEEMVNHVIEHNRLPMGQVMEEGEKKAERENLDKQAKGKAESCILCDAPTNMCSRTLI